MEHVVFGIIMFVTMSALGLGILIFRLRNNSNDKQKDGKVES